MDPQTFVRTLRAQWWIVAATALVCLGAGAALTLSIQKQYAATAQLFVSTASADVGTINAGNTFAQARVQSYVSMADTPSVVEFVKSELKLNLSDNAIAAKITASAPANKVLINVRVVDTQAKRAADIANSASNRMVVAVQNLEQTGNRPSPVRLTVIHPASAPSGAFQPRATLNLGLALILGLLLGVGLALLRDRFDTRVKSVPALERQTGLAVIGVSPKARTVPAGDIAYQRDPQSAAARELGGLASTMRFLRPDDPPKVIAVVSGVNDDGKTHTAINLAAALAAAGHRVCLVDADLSTPSIAAALALPADPGLSTLLIGQATMAEALREISPNLFVITSGPATPTAGAMLASARARDAIRALAAEFDFVVLDSASLTSVTDPGHAAGLAQASIMVVRLGKDRVDDVDEAMAVLDRAGVRPSGLLLSRPSRQAMTQVRSRTS